MKCLKNKGRVWCLHAASQVYEQWWASVSTHEQLWATMSNREHAWATMSMHEQERASVSIVEQAQATVSKREHLLTSVEHLLIVEEQLWAMPVRIIASMAAWPPGMCDLTSLSRQKHLPDIPGRYFLVKKSDKLFKLRFEMESHDLVVQ